MGDRFYADVKCYNCGKVNENVYYAESCGFDYFTCYSCRTLNSIAIRLVGVPYREPKDEDNSDDSEE